MKVRNRTKFVAAACLLMAAPLNYASPADAHSSGINVGGVAIMSARSDEKFRQNGVQEMNGGNLESALEDLDQAILLNPSNEQAYYDRGMVYARLEQSKSAMADFSTAIQMNPGLASARIERAKLFMMDKQYAQATLDLSAAMRDQKESGRALYYRGLCYRQLRHGDKAAADFYEGMRICQAANQRSGYNFCKFALADQYHQNGRIAALNGNFRLAISDYDQAMSLNPDSAGTLLDRAIAEDATGDENNALEDLTAAIAKAPILADAHTQRGNVLFKMNDIGGAQKEYTVALQIDPRDPDAHYAKGRCLQILGYREAAIKEFSTAKTLYAYVENEEGSQAAQARIAELA